MRKDFIFIKIIALFLQERRTEKVGCFLFKRNFPNDEKIDDDDHRSNSNDSIVTRLSNPKQQS